MGAKELAENVKRTLRRTSIEIVIGGLIGVGIAGYGSYSHETSRANRIPLAFSEIREIEKEADEKDMRLGPMTRYLPAVNDTSMKIFESWNNANETSDPVAAFSHELQNKMQNIEFSSHYSLRDFLKMLPERSGEALNQLKEFRAVRDRMGPIVNDLSNSWTASHIDHYHTEYYTTTESYTDSNGKSQTRTVTKSREVYDYTRHTYNYSPHSGENASASLDRLLSEGRKLEFTERMEAAKKTNGPNRDAMVGSRKPEETEKFRDDDFLRVANIWRTGSTLMTNLPVIGSRYSGLPATHNSWKHAKGNAHSTSYTTYSHSDSGPIEFQVARQALDHTNDLYQNLDQLVGGIEFVNSNAKPLSDMIESYIEAGGKGSNAKQPTPKEMSKAIIETARTFYRQNFKAGLDVDRFRWYMIALFGLLGMAAGCAAGAYIDKRADAEGWWGKEDWGRYNRY
ncbi:MAG: hypothetical protein AABX47_06825 [Nanoarchaeota archaeon]